MAMSYVPVFLHLDFLFLLILRPPDSHYYGDLCPSQPGSPQNFQTAHSPIDTAALRA